MPTNTGSWKANEADGANITVNRPIAIPAQTHPIGIIYFFQAAYFSGNDTARDIILARPGINDHRSICIFSPFDR